MKGMNISDQSLLRLERAADELRRGQPVVVTAGDRALLVLPLELATTPALERFDTMVTDSFVMLTNNRALSLKVAGEDWAAVRLERPEWMTAEDMVALADPTLDLASPLKGPYSRINHPSTALDEAAIKMVKWARLLPAVLAAEVEGAKAFPDQMAVDADAVLNADFAQAAALRQVASARVPLAGAENTRLVSFRPTAGGIEHIAIIIGEPNRHDPVLMRIHSECFTGDLLGSLKCDCGEQLRGAIKAIEEAGGGVLLYLAQEGRGIGLISKLKAYALQDQGYDTVDANTRLGFDVDERVFAPAAEMLKQLGFGAVRLMTNNPDKVAGLERFGVKVAERVAHKFPTNPHNEQYLATKKAKTGHIL
ncbi:MULTISPECIES: GTP cyclohydrolase II [Kordiimonas]|jgi:GTP cyclohydrolase II|uniref:GTP cyclohydrolase II n=1 Tax=Kordiimonas TaxID=288021 RepID=UPI00257E7568|nr:GTP cyclohydrolase II [Kordiimonas sp. UBA4487]